MRNYVYFAEKIGDDDHDEVEEDEGKEEEEDFHFIGSEFTLID